MAWHDKYPHNIFVNCLTANGMLVDWKIGSIIKRKAAEYKNIPEEILTYGSTLRTHSWKIICENEDDKVRVFSIDGPALIKSIADETHPKANIIFPIEGADETHPKANIIFPIEGYEKDIVLQDRLGKNVKPGDTVAFVNNTSILGLEVSRLKHGEIVKITPDDQLLIEYVKKTSDNKLIVSYSKIKNNFYLIKNTVKSSMSVIQRTQKL